jgi:hypothetical protein
MRQMAGKQLAAEISRRRAASATPELAEESIT